MSRKEALAELIAKVEAGDRTASLRDTPLKGHGKLYEGALNGSLDAAKALHEAVLPGMFWNMGHLDNPSLGYVCTVAAGHFADSPSWRGFADTPARAWLLSILRALHAQEGGEA